VEQCIPSDDTTGTSYSGKGSPADAFYTRDERAKDNKIYLFHFLQSSVNRLVCRDN
jgi:hypothetical protein